MRQNTGNNVVRSAKAVAAIGMVVAAYLTWTHFDIDTLVCSVGDCHTVQSSEFATIGPVPIALLGFVMYTFVVVCHFVGLKRPALEFATTAMAFATALAGALYAVYLTWLELAVIHAVCQWCVASASLTMLLLVLEWVLILRALRSPNRAPDETAAAGAAS